MTPELCICGAPIADCPHLTGFGSYEEKARFYRMQPARVAAMAKLDAVADRAGAKQLLALAQQAHAEASKLPVGEALRDALAIIGAALAKAMALGALD